MYSFSRLITRPAGLKSHLPSRVVIGVREFTRNHNNPNAIEGSRLQEINHHVPDPPKIQVVSNWNSLDDQPLTRDSIWDLLRNAIPSIRHRNFLTEDECRKSVDVIQRQQVGSYDLKMVFPRVGSVGTTQFDSRYDKTAYFEGVPEANTLQDLIKQEAEVDIIGRVAALLEETTGLKTRLAQEGEKQYFCGLLRVVDNYIQIHPDFGPYDGPDWEIGKIAAQLTWNILLKQVPGGDTIIYDRQWQGAEDDKCFQKQFPRYAYDPRGVQGHVFKALPAVEGDLTFFNPRNFHEVKPCDRAWDRPDELVRYTMSSFVGLLPGDAGSPPCLIMWS